MKRWRERKIKDAAPGGGGEVESNCVCGQKKGLVNRETLAERYSPSRPLYCTNTASRRGCGKGRKGHRKRLDLPGNFRESLPNPTLLLFFFFPRPRPREGPLWLRRRGGGGRRKSPFFFLFLRCGGVRKKGFCGLDSREGKSERGEGPTELDVVKIETQYLP